ncbi:magnesium chelatase, partial [Actinomadura bangladeshensis]|nr:magnesium chelatase [Actinomadura bangladeshensis]
EEGELRPQLLDRFGLTVEVRASREPRERAEVVRRRLAFEADPEAFAARWAGAEAGLAERISAARERLGGVRLPDERLEQIAAVCAGFEVDGLRADLVTANAALAHAAWQGRDEVTQADVRAAARLSLPHRRRRDPFDAPGLDESLLDDLLASTAPDDDPPPEGGGAPSDGDTPRGAGGAASDDKAPGDGAPPGDDRPRGESTPPRDARSPGDLRSPGDTDTSGHTRQPADAKPSGNTWPPGDWPPGDGGPSSEARSPGVDGSPGSGTPDGADGRLGGGERVAAVAAPHAVPFWDVPGVGDGAA